MSSFQYAIDPQGDVQTTEELIAWSANSSWQRYWLFHRFCQDRYQQVTGGPPAPLAGGNALAERGISLHPGMLNLGGCNAMTQAIDQYMADVLPENGTPDLSYTVPWTGHQAHLLKRILPQILSPSVEAELEEYYGSYFQVLAVNLRRNFPSDGRDVSFLWHRDHEPSQQVHLIVYLSGASDEGGRTEVLDFQATREAAEAGYSFPSLEDRSDDLNAVFGRQADDVTITSPEFGPGGGLLFAAPRALHRGRLPRTKWRDTLLFLFLPSPVPWRDRLAHTFNSVLMNGANVSSCMVNPLRKFARSEMAHHGDAPDWAKLGELYPPDGKP
ncbi:MAG TPA: hypothetical protein DCG48_04140 [Rhodospirillaceae bacterium]|nr:hypothetical protein [Rhodospirillaceae bacterium]|tara:strand:- start:18864 stop:19847 length:984 start_codon:yes stop_codon:yes gene_type:complete